MGFVKTKKNLEYHILFFNERIHGIKDKKIKIKMSQYLSSTLHYIVILSRNYGLNSQNDKLYISNYI